MTNEELETLINTHFICKRRMCKCNHKKLPVRKLIIYYFFQFIIIFAVFHIRYLLNTNHHKKCCRINTAAPVIHILVTD